MLRTVASSFVRQSKAFQATALRAYAAGPSTLEDGLKQWTAEDFAQAKEWPVWSAAQEARVKQAQEQLGDKSSEEIYKELEALCHGDEDLLGEVAATKRAMADFMSRSEKVSDEYAKLKAQLQNDAYWNNMVKLGMDPDYVQDLKEHCQEGWDQETLDAVAATFQDPNEPLFLEWTDSKIADIKKIEPQMKAFRAKLEAKKKTMTDFLDRIDDVTIEEYWAYMKENRGVDVQTIVQDEVREGLWFNSASPSQRPAPAAVADGEAHEFAGMSTEEIMNKILEEKAAAKN